MLGQIASRNAHRLRMGQRSLVDAVPTSSSASLGGAVIRISRPKISPPPSALMAQRRTLTTSPTITWTGLLTTTAARNNNTSSLRSFSSSSSSAQLLVDLLVREHAEEVSESDDSMMTVVMPPELAAVKATVEETWKLVDDGALTRLYRTLIADDNNNGTAAAKVQISFHCQDTIENADAAALDDEHDENNDQDNMTLGEQSEDEEEEEEEAVPVRFTISITKAGKTLVMVCVTTEDVSVAIQSTAITTEDVDTIHGHGGAVKANNYQGPEFGELAEDLQDAFHNFLFDDVGLSEDVISFIAMYCDYKEQEQYVAFLEDAKSLLS